MLAIGTKVIRTCRVVFVFLLLINLVLILGCETSNSSQSICDEKFLSQRSTGEALFETKEVGLSERFEFDTLVSEIEHQEERALLVDSDSFWYTNGANKFIACFVFDGSERVNAVLIVDVDQSGSEFRNFRFLGSP